MKPKILYVLKKNKSKYAKYYAYRTGYTTEFTNKMQGARFFSSHVKAKEHLSILHNERRVIMIDAVVVQLLINEY